MAHVDLLAMDCTAASCFLECCDQAFLAVGIIQVEADVLRLELGANILQHTFTCLCTESNASNAFDPVTVFCQQSCQLSLGAFRFAISKEQDELLCCGRKSLWLPRKKNNCISYGTRLWFFKTKYKLGNPRSYSCLHATPCHIWM